MQCFRRQNSLKLREFVIIKQLFKAMILGWAVVGE
jgi:hypothetical protein